MSVTAAVPDFSIASTQSVGKRIASNSGLMVGSKTIGAVLGLLTLIITERALNDPVLFGTVVFIHSYMLFFAEVGTFQPFQTIIRFGQDDIEREDADGFARLLKFSVKLDAVSAVVSTAAAVALFGLVMWIASLLPLPERQTSLGPGDLQLYTSVYCLLILFRQIGAATGVFRIFDNFRALALKALIMPVLRFVGAVVAAQQGWGIVGFLAVWFLASATGYVFLPIYAAFELKRRNLLGRVLRAKVSFLHPRKGVWPFAIKSSLDSTLDALQVYLPTLLVTAVFGQAVTGIYKIAEEVAKLLSEGARLINEVIYPELVRFVTDGRIAEMWRVVRRSSLILLAVGAAISAAVVLAGPAPFNAIFRQDFTLASPIAAVLVPSAVIAAMTAPIYPVMYAFGKPERTIYARATGMAVYVAAFFALAHWLGPIGAAWAVIVGNGCALVLAFLYARRSIREAAP